MDIEQLAGTKLGNCEVEPLLGRDGMGVMYKARQEKPADIFLSVLPSCLGVLVVRKSLFGRTAMRPYKRSVQSVKSVVENPVPGFWFKNKRLSFFASFAPRVCDPLRFKCFGYLTLVNIK